MRDKTPRDYRNTATEVGIYANICENQAGKRTWLCILIGVCGWLVSGFCLFIYFFKVVQTHG